MTAVLIIAAAIVLLVIGYVTYGSWLAKQWGIDPKRKTPAVELEDGVDYVAAKPAVLMGHHFSSIAGAGPINGPIQAYFSGASSAASSSADSRTSVPCSRPSATAASPWVRSFPTPWAPGPRSSSSSSPCWC